MPLLHVVRPLALVLSLCLSTRALAGAEEYFCKVAQDLEVQGDGTLSKPLIGSMVGRSFAVSRNTGQVIIPDSSLFMSGEMKFRVLAPGNRRNNFVTIGTAPAGDVGTFTLLLTVEEFVESRDKPFFLSAGLRGLAGTCE
jgi:hypothetical protein